MSFWKRAKDKSVIDRLLDEQMHALAVQEIASGVRRDGLWAKANIEGGGDEQLAKLTYLKLLVQHLKDEHYIAERLKEVGSRASERERAKQERRAQEMRSAAERKARKAGKKSSPAEAQDATHVEQERVTPSYSAEKAELARRLKHPRPKNKRVLSLCLRLLSDDLALDQYKVLASFVGGSVSQRGFFGGTYEARLDDTTVELNNINALRPWFIDNILPRVLSVPA